MQLSNNLPQSFPHSHIELPTYQTLCFPGSLKGLLSVAAEITSPPESPVETRFPRSSPPPQNQCILKGIWWLNLKIVTVGWCYLVPLHFKPLRLRSAVCHGYKPRKQKHLQTHQDRCFFQLQAWLHTQAAKFPVTVSRAAISAEVIFHASL